MKKADTDAMKAILDKHSNLFQEELGKLKGVQGKAHVDGDRAPIVFKSRPLPYARREEIEEKLKRQEQDQVIQPVKYSDWATPHRSSPDAQRTSLHLW